MKREKKHFIFLFLQTQFRNGKVNVTTSAIQVETEFQNLSR